jgi:Ca2+-transporting ATPase
LLQLGNALALRSDRDSLFKLGFRTNRFLSWVVLATLAVQLAIIYWAPLQTLLKTDPLNPLDLGIVLIASTGALWIVEAEKLLRRRRRNRVSAADAPSR